MKIWRVTYDKKSKDYNLYLEKTYRLKDDEY